MTTVPSSMNWGTLLAWLRECGIVTSVQRVRHVISTHKLLLHGDWQDAAPDFTADDGRAVLTAMTGHDPDEWVQRARFQRRLHQGPFGKRAPRGSAAWRRTDVESAKLNGAWAQGRPTPGLEKRALALYFAAHPEFLEVPGAGHAFDLFRDPAGEIFVTNNPVKCVDWPQWIWDRGGWVCSYAYRRRLRANDWLAAMSKRARTMAAVTVMDPQTGRESWVRAPGHHFGLPQGTLTPLVAPLSWEAWEYVQPWALEAHPDADWWAFPGRRRVISIQKIREAKADLEGEKVGLDPEPPPHLPESETPHAQP